MKYDLITSEKIKYHLRTHTFGQKIFAYWSIRSTNELAYKFARNGESEGTLVIAEEQVQGRGRMKRKWHSPFGKGLWFSLILRPPVSTSKAGLYPYLAGVSVAVAIEEKIGLKPTVKWPNDLLFNEKKFCGILAEVEFLDRKVNFIILGIGINIDQKLSEFDMSLKNTATSLRIESKLKIDRTALLAEILNVFERHYYFTNEYGFDTITALWKKRCPRLGQPIEIFQGSHSYNGIFEDLDEDGCLLLRKKDGNLIKVAAGDFY